MDKVNRNFFSWKLSPARFLCVQKTDNPSNDLSFLIQIYWLIDWLIEQMSFGGIKQEFIIFRSMICYVDNSQLILKYFLQVDQFTIFLNKRLLLVRKWPLDKQSMWWWKKSIHFEINWPKLPRSTISMQL